jgi:hypothetical protein
MKPKLSDIYHPGQKVTLLDVEWTVTKVQDEIASPFASAFPDVEPAVKATLYLGRVIPGRETEQCDVSNHITELVKPSATGLGSAAQSSLRAAMQQQYGYQPDFSNAKMQRSAAQESGLRAAMQNQSLGGGYAESSAATGSIFGVGTMQGRKYNLLDQLLQHHIDRYEATSEPVTTLANQVATSLVEELRTMGLEIRPITDPK